MAKSPHTPEFRAKVSQEYLDGSSYSFLVEKYGIGKTTLRQWVAKYRLYGIAAFIKPPGNSSYSSNFKKMCVEAVLSGEGSVDHKCELKQVILVKLRYKTHHFYLLGAVFFLINNGNIFYL